MTAQVRRHRYTTYSHRRRGVILALAMLAAAAAVPLEFGRQALVSRLINETGALVGGAPLALAVAGWLTYGLLPLFAIVLDRDHRARYGRPGVSPLDDSTLLIRRIRANEGHRVARRPVHYWITRSPLVPILAVAVVFLPMPFTQLVADLHESEAGAAFLIGWQWSCVAALLGVMVIVLAPVAAAFRSPRAVAGTPTRLYAAAALPSIVALGIALFGA
jgi:hypothetical protein